MTDEEILADYKPTKSKRRCAFCTSHACYERVVTAITTTLDRRPGFVVQCQHVHERPFYPRPRRTHPNH